MAAFPAKPLIQKRRVMLDPPPDRDVIHGQAALRHDLLQVAIGKRISQVPANAQEDNHIFEMPPAEQCRPSSVHDTTLPDQFIRVCNRTEITTVRLNFLLRAQGTWNQ
jgi:hypothetical protein